MPPETSDRSHDWDRERDRLREGASMFRSSLEGKYSRRSSFGEGFSVWMLAYGALAGKQLYRRPGKEAGIIGDLE